MAKRLVFVAWLVCAVLAVRASAQGGVEEVESCMRANLPERTSVQTGKLRSTGPAGSQRTLDGKIYWKRSPQDLSQTLIEIEAPADVRGSAYLVLERKDGTDMFVYLPELKRTRRVHPRTVSGSLFGTDFGYEDIQRLQTISGGSRSERLPDSNLDGRPVYVVRSHPAPEDGSAYERIVYSVDKETCVPLRVEFFGAGENLLKVVSADPGTLSRSGKGWIVRSLTVRDVKKETQTELVVDKIELDVELPDRLFTQTNLERR